jgi:hypothetical protein
MSSKPTRRCRLGPLLAIESDVLGIAHVLAGLSRKVILAHPVDRMPRDSGGASQRVYGSPTLRPCALQRSFNGARKNDHLEGGD